MRALAFRLARIIIAELAVAQGATFRALRPPFEPQLCAPDPHPGGDRLLQAALILSCSRLRVEQLRVRFISRRQT
jgi:hypothetical protein